MERRSLSDYLFYGALAAVLVGFLFFFVVNNRDVWAEKGCLDKLLSCFGNGRQGHAATVASHVASTKEFPEFGARITYSERQTSSRAQCGCWINGMKIRQSQNTFVDDGQSDFAIGFGFSTVRHVDANLRLIAGSIFRFGTTNNCIESCA